MTRRKGLVLDANILLRAVFGQRVRELLEAFGDAVTFYSPDVCFDDARKYIPDVSARRRIDPLPGLAVLEEVSNIVESVDKGLYEDYETVARGLHGCWISRFSCGKRYGTSEPSPRTPGPSLPDRNVALHRV
jgi:PIN domain